MSTIITPATSTSLKIIPVTNKSQQKAFINFAWDLYADDPNWVPPLLMNYREMLNFKKHPFYDEGGIQTWLAMRGNKIVGRIAAIINAGHNKRYGETRGFFGFFESIDDQAVATALFDTARAWLKERGMTTLRGPVNPSLNYELGLLVDGFDTPPFFMMSYNKPYFEDLMKHVGLTKTQDLFAFEGHASMIEKLDPKLKFIVDTAQERFNIKVRTLNRKKFQEDVEVFLDVYNRSLVSTWGFVPLTPAEMKHIATGLKQLIIPEMTLYAEVDGKPIGVCFALLDYNPRIKAINGRLFPFGFIKLLWNRRAIKNIRIISANVVPEYQRWGVGLILLNGLVPKIYEWGIENVEISWVLESNHLSRATLEKGGAILSKTYRLYDGDL
jgi:GNAT superfamily N-acetyltransferase